MAGVLYLYSNSLFTPTPPARARSVVALFWQGFFAPPRHRPPIQPIQFAAIVRPYTRVRATVQETRVFDTCVRNGAVNRVRYYVCGSKNTIYRHDRENSRRAPPVQSITTELCRQDVPILSCPPFHMSCGKGQYSSTNASL